MRAVWAATIIPLVLMSPATSAQTADPIAAAIAANVARVQARLPIRVDEHTTLLSVLAVGKTAKYAFQLKTHKEHVPPKWYVLQKEVLIKNACGVPAVRNLMKEGASYHYMYTDIKSRYVVEIRVRDSDCQ